MLRVVQKISELFTLFCLAFFALTIINNPAHASEMKADVNITPKLSITIPNKEVKVALSAGSSTDSKNVDLGIQVSTNNPAGYYMTVDSDTTKLTNTKNAAYFIETISSPVYSEYSMDNNTWGYRVGENGNYLPFVPGAQVASSDTPVNGKNVNFRVGTRIDNTLAPGTYEIELEFVAVANPIPVTYMQDLEDYLCPKSPMIVVDARDDEEYLVQKLADGNCWMLDNLRLDPTEVSLETLKGNTNATNEALTYLKNGGGSSPYATTSVVSQIGWPSDEKFSEPLVNTEYADTVISDEYNYGIGSGKIGTYYNYCAATAGSYCYPSGAGDGDATEDICPTGWRLPTGGSPTPNENPNEFQELYSAYGEDREAFNFNFGTIFSGGYFGNYANRGYYGSFWSSTFSTTYQMHYLSVNTDYVGTYAGTDRYRGFSIRCMKYIEPSVDITTVTYLQDVTSALVAGTAPGTTATLKDKRDNEEYEVAKLADGNLWMLDNLRTDPSAISLETLKGNTNASDQTLTYLKNGGGTSPYATAGINTSTSSNLYNIPFVNTMVKNSLVTVGYSGGEPRKNGALYNYCAASAGSYCYPSGSGTGNATEDICPAGWRMPTGGDNGDYGVLYQAYSSNGSALNEALKLPLAGYVSSSSSSPSTGSSGYYWTSTFDSNSAMTVLYAGSNSASPTGSDTRYWGDSVRCIFNKE